MRPRLADLVISLCVALASALVAFLLDWVEPAIDCSFFLLVFFFGISAGALLSGIVAAECHVLAAPDGSPGFVASPGT